MLTQADTNEQAFIERRYGCLGASDLARAATGEFGGMSQVVAEKIYRTASEPNDLMELGKLAEPAILAWFEAQTGRNVEGRQRVAVSPHGLIQATCDAVTLDGIYTLPVEAKLVFPWSRHKWQADDGGDRVSDYAYTQVQTQMLCLEAPRGFVPAWFVGEGKRYFEVPGDEDFQRNLESAAQRIWNEYVIPKQLPIPNQAVDAVEAWSPRIRKALAGVAVHEGEIMQATDGQTEFVETWERVKRVATQFGNAADAARDWILAQMGTAELILLSDGRRYRRSCVERKGFVVEPGQHVELREVKDRKRKELTNE